MADTENYGPAKIFEAFFSSVKMKKLFLLLHCDLNDFLKASKVKKRNFQVSCDFDLR